MRQLLTAFFFFIIFNGRAQDAVIIKTDTLSFYETIKLPFNKIEVVDARFDQTKLGFVHWPMLFTAHKKRTVTFPDSLRRYLPYFMTSFVQLNDSSHKSLLIIIKKFRVAENFMTSIQKTLNNNLTLNISASCYSNENGALTKLFSVEDILMEYVDMVADTKIDLINYKGNQRAAILTRMMHKLFASKSWNYKESNLSFVKADLDSAIRKRFLLPIFSKQPIVGLYKTFNEFKMASPSVTDIRIIYKKGEIYSISGNDSMPVNLANYWGFSDGSKSYLIFRGEVSELEPCGKSFRILSYRTLDELAGRAVISDKSGDGFFKNLASGGKMREYFDLDMDTGELFLEEAYGKSNIKRL